MLFQLKFPEKGIVGSERISSLPDLIESQKNFYNNYHYRLLNHTVLQLLLLLPAWVFDVLNTIVFLVLPLCLLRVNSSSTKDYGLKYLSLLFFIWIFHFNLGRSYFLTTGSLNYSWFLIPQLFYLTELLRCMEGKGNRGLLALFALLNVNANENVLLVLFGLTAVAAFYSWRNRSIDSIRSELWPLMFAAVVLLAGGLFMLASPSLDVRLEEQGYRSAGLGSHLLEYGKRTVFYVIRFVPVLLLAWMWRVDGHKARRRKNILLLLTVIGSLGVMVGVPLFEARSAVFGFFVLLMWVVSLSEDIAVGVKGVLLLLLLAVLVSTSRLPAYKQAQVRHDKNQTILNHSQRVVRLLEYCDRTAREYLLCHRLSTDPEFIDNKSLAAVYGKLAVSKRKTRYERVDDIEGFETFGGKMFYKRSHSNSLIILIKNEEPGKKFIVRGSKKGFGKHSIMNLLLPEELRISFLDYLEDITVETQDQIQLASGKYYRLNQSLLGAYSYLLISEYDMEKHRRVGEIYRVELIDGY